MAFDLKDLKFLVVDDNEHLHTMVRAALAPFGARHFHFAFDGKGALESFATFKPDIMVTNWLMKPMDGIRLVTVMRDREKSPNPYLPIIMLTSHTELHHVMKARDVGCNEVMAKPLSPKGLLDRISFIIEKPRAFVQTDDYFGPDRRRRQLPFDGDNRRKNTKAPMEGGPRQIGMKKRKF